MCTSTYKLTFTFLQRRLLDYLLFWGSRQLPPSQVSSPPCNSNESVLGQVSRAEGQEKTQILTWSEQKEAQGHLYSVQQNLPLHKAPWQSPENVKHLSGMRPHHYLISLFIWKSLSESTSLNETLVPLQQNSGFHGRWWDALVVAFTHRSVAVGVVPNTHCIYTTSTWQGQGWTPTYVFWGTQTSTNVLSRHFLTNTSCDKGSGKSPLHKWDLGRAEIFTMKSVREWENLQESMSYILHYKG